MSGGVRVSGRTGIDPPSWAARRSAGRPPTPQLDFHLNLHEPMGEVEVTNVTGAGQTRYLGFGVGVSWWFSPVWPSPAASRGWPMPAPTPRRRP
ncbi:MAG: hypothetical protein R3F43_07400 [bacterium]